MDTKQVVVSVVIVFLACACSHLCTADIQSVVEECAPLLEDATKNGSEPIQSCSDVRAILDCYKRIEAQIPPDLNYIKDMIRIRDDDLYFRMMRKGIEECNILNVGGAPRPSVGFVLIAVSVISMLLAVNRY